MGDFHYREEFCRRLTALRMESGASARDMSLSLGLSESYINKIENGKTLPSMNTFFDICDFLGITPRDFFNTAEAFPLELNIATEEMNKMSKEQLSRITEFMKEINHRK